MKIYEISLRLLTTYLVTDFDTIVSQFKSTDYKTNQYWLCFAVYMWWVQGRVHYGAWSPGVWWADDYWWVPFPPCTGAWRPVAGMCKLDQVSPLRPGEASYHNQGWDMRPPVNNTIHHTWGWHLLIFTSISLPLSFNIGALEDVTYLNIKNISFQHAKFPPDDGLHLPPLTKVRRWVLCVPSSRFLFPAPRLEGKAVICAAGFIRVIGFMVMVYCSQFVNSKNMETGMMS